ncbi:hypothetical protein D3C78_1884280 [compost metagenome]
MDSYGSVIAHGIEAPDTFIQRIPAEDDIRIDNQEVQQVEFLLLQLQLPAVQIGSVR